MTESIQFYKKSIGGIKGRITYFNNQLNENPNMNLGELKSMMNRLKMFYEKFNSAQTKYEILDPDADITVRDDFDDIYGAVESKLISRIDSAEKSTNGNYGNDPTTSIGIPLPEMKIPEFDGEFLSWNNFRDIYKELIHENERLNGVLKFHYLKTALSNGTAYHFIENLSATTDNYNQVWSALFKFYDNETRVKFLHMHEIYYLKPVSRPNDAKALQVFINCFWKHYNSLKSLKIPIEHWDLYLVFHVCELVDPISRQQIEKNKQTDKIITITEVMDILSQRARLLESMSMYNEQTLNNWSKSDKITSSTNSSSRRDFSKASNSFVTSETTSTCFYCKLSHSIFKCTSFDKLSVSERYEWVVKEKLCRNCFYQHHTNSCKMKGCRICHRNHHTLLHRNKSDWNSLNSSEYLAQTDSKSSNLNSHVETTSAAANIKNSTEPGIQVSNPLTTSPGYGFNVSPQPISTSSTTSSNFITSQPENLVEVEKEPVTCLHTTHQILLATAIIWVEGPTGIRQQCRVLLDSGSQSNFITENLCQMVKANKESIYLPVTGINERVTHIKHKVNLLIQSRVTDFTSELAFLVLPKITSDLPLHRVQFDFNSLPKQLVLSDPHFYIPQTIDMLLGAEIYLSLMIGEMSIVVNELPPFQNTVFGNVVCGRVTNSYKTPLISLHCCDVSSLKNDIQKFWQTEEINCKNIYSIEEKLAEEHYRNNVKRNFSGRYSVAVPFKSNLTQLGDSYNNSLKQFLHLEKKLACDPDLNKLYKDFMNEYISLNHMELVDPSQNTSNYSYFIPHHGVYKENSTTTKLRVVFNASSKTSTGISLNDCTLVGPTIQPDLFDILIRFRKFIIALTADITKMYRQVLVHQTDRSLQQVLWRNSADVPIQIYQLNTVTYGTASAPFLAIRTLKQLALDECKNFPRESQILLKHFYVDDCLTGANNLEDAIQIKQNLTSLLAKGGFELRKWMSNNKDVIPNNESSNINVVSTLGVIWDSNTDSIQIWLSKLDFSTLVFTKRSVLSQIAQLFDPLGLCAPVVFTAKLFMQKLWSFPEIKWDDPLTEPLHVEWFTFLSELKALNCVKVPRCVNPFENPLSVELHGFGDASESGYGCCVYIRTVDKSGIINCQLLCAKSKVAPLKKQTIPRLELCASLLLAQLYTKVIESLEVPFNNVTLWSDSEVTLCRIKSQPSKFATFVAHRVSHIQDLTDISMWKYVPTKLNPADIVSRSLMPSTLPTNELWWNGPCFLSEPQETWPLYQNANINYDDPELSKSNVLLEVNEPLINDLILLYSNYNKLLRISALCLRFSRNTKLSREDRSTGEISAEEMDLALKGIVKFLQINSFAAEIKLLKKGDCISANSFIKNLNPFLDSSGILRVGGRLQNSALSYGQIHQMLLPSTHYFTQLLVRNEHYRNLHAGPQALLSFIRQKFWIIGGRGICRKTVRECIICFKAKPPSIDQQMGQLPVERVQSFRAFQHIGIDYCGPFQVNYKIRSKIISKVYIALFICFSTKATHLEVVHDLSTNAFIAAFRRFISRRGRCSSVCTDNATNFVGAKGELRELQQLFNSELHRVEVFKFYTEEGINWRTIPPRSPHFGGLWEAAVKSTKFHLKRCLGNYICTTEELTTLVVQIECCLNSRPLTPLSSDPSDYSALTPGHFLIGCPINSVPEPSLLHLDFNRLSRYQRLQHILQQFWQRWSDEYLSELQQRQKWVNVKSNVKPGILVLLKEDNVPPMKWVMGRICETHPGADKLVRVVTVKTQYGIFRRAIAKICVLPIEQSFIADD